MTRATHRREPVLAICRRNAAPVMVALVIVLGLLTWRFGAERT